MSVVQYDNRIQQNGMDKENNGKTNGGTLSPLIQFQKAQCTVLIPLLAILVPKTTPRTEGS